jgi:hypothetical protein
MLRNAAQCPMEGGFYVIKEAAAAEAEAGRGRDMERDRGRATGPWGLLA